MYQKILVPVDDSETCAAALQEAARFAKDQQAKVRLVHVIDLAQFAWSANEFLDVPQLQEALRSAGKRTLATQTERMQQAGVTVEGELLEAWGGNLAKTIVEDALKWGAEVIVMGTHGYGGLTHLLLGSVAEGVMHQTTLPVLLIRAKRANAS
ncbi:Nucleotide-binding universal stress protein, UspA family [Andreprevotia lacus DSM 23236]|jgi:nucleotide-binding universal stress UspA family protein|uniref:Universal stress protein n=1 Tax=Andreprevotia lacus DSM 23236 TaxID=1121001 RepID=A0A1W1XW37_9NEIS|nr:universal stress protein [Andreprevotia lacus]SMC28179.1 Nucleotide-binding universal stress protein, UspA family [Andreprevotia lacus DSM 23236]